MVCVYLSCQLREPKRACAGSGQFKCLGPPPAARRARPPGPGSTRHLGPWTPPPTPPAWPGRPRRFFAPAPGTPTGPARRPRRPGLAEPRSSTAAGRGQQRRRRRARRGAEGRGAGLGLPPTAALPAARDPATPTPSPRAAHPRGRRLRFLPATARLPPSAFLKPLLLPPLPPPRREGARPRPRRERSRRTGARAARALGTAR